MAKEIRKEIKKCHTCTYTCTHVDKRRERGGREGGREGEHVLVFLWQLEFHRAGVHYVLDLLKQLQMVSCQNPSISLTNPCPTPQQGHSKITKNKIITISTMKILLYKAKLI